MTINWNEALPSANSAVGRSPKEIRSLWSSVAVGLGGTDGPVYWDGSGSGSELSRGTPKPGGFRTFYDVESNASYSGLSAVGRLYYASDTSRLLTFDDSGATRLVGTRGLVEGESRLGSALSNAYVRQSGSWTTNEAVSSTTDITFAQAFNTTPHVSLSASTGSSTLALVTVSPTGFTSQVSWIGGAQSLVTVYWVASGIVSGAI